MSVQVLLAAERPVNCPVCTCPNSELPQRFEPPAIIYSKETNENLEPIKQSLPGVHMGPNEISNSAELFSREILKVNDCFHSHFKELIFSLIIFMIVIFFIDFGYVSADCGEKFRSFSIFRLVINGFGG